MKQIILIIFFIFISISKSIKTPDYSCMNTIVTTSGIEKSLFNTDGTEYDFCGSNNMACDSQGYITTLYLRSTKLDISTIVLSCLERLNNLTLDNFATFDSTSIGNLDNLGIKALTLLTPTNINSIGELKSIQEFNIKIDINIPTINLSSFTNLKKFTHVQVSEGSGNGLVTFQNDLSSSINLETFLFTAREIPNLSLVGVDQLTIGYYYGTNTTSKVENFSTFSLVKSLKLRNILGGTAIPFPDQLLLIPNGGLLTSFVTDNGFLGVSRKLDLSLLSKLEYFSIISTTTSNLRFSGPNDGFPFSSFPSSLTYFEFINQGTQVKLGGAEFLNSNLKTVILKNDNLVSSSSGLPSTWPSKTITKLDVTNNPLLMSSISTLDSSYCSVDISISGAGFPSDISLPTCFTCHFGNSNYKSYSFNGVTKNPVCTTLIPTALESTKNGKIIVVGTDLGFDGSWISSSITNNPSWVVDINSKQIHADSNFEGLFNLTYSSTANSPQTFTLYNIQKPPMPTTITSTNTQITIKGSYFSYDKSEIKVYLGSSLKFCTIVSSTFYEIVCNYDYSAQVESSSYIQVRSLKSSLFTIKLLEENNYSTCSVDCPTNKCDLATGACMCDPICQNGGTCNSDGSCNCPSKWKGTDCTIPAHYISSVKETTTEGGLVEMYGFFGDIHNNSSVFIGNQKCIIQNINDTYADCIIGKGQGETKLNMTQNGFSVTIDYRFINSNKQCLNNCSGIGTCDSKTSNCICPKGYTSAIDCSIKDNDGAPGTSIDHGDLGSTNFLNENTNFSISVISLVEVSVDGSEVLSYPLESNWGNRSYSNNIYSYTQPLADSSNISLMIQEIKEDTQFNFADDLILLKANSLKISLSINNYQFKSSLNTLKLLFKSTVVSQSEECNKQEFNVENYNNIETSNVLVIQKDKKYLYGSFYKKTVSDGRPTFSPSNVIKNDKNSSVIVELNLPHCTSQCLIDPDFSLLVSNDFDSKCDTRAKWVLPVAIVVPVVGLAAIVIISAIIYKKNKIALRVMKVKLKELNKSNDK